VLAFTLPAQGPRTNGQMRADSPRLISWLLRKTESQVLQLHYLLIQLLE
jgi:hypothetical protein